MLGIENSSRFPHGDYRGYFYVPLMRIDEFDGEDLVGSVDGNGIFFRLLIQYITSMLINSF